jgi:hypothetical protein
MIICHKFENERINTFSAPFSMFSMMPKLRGLDTGFLLQRYVLNPDDSK